MLKKPLKVVKTKYKSDEILGMLDFCLERSGQRTERFILSLHDQFARTNSLSRTQMSTLENIYTKLGGQL